MSSTSASGLNTRRPSATKIHQCPTASGRWSTRSGSTTASPTPNTRRSIVLQVKPLNWGEDDDLTVDTSVGRYRILTESTGYRAIIISAYGDSLFQSTLKDGLASLEEAMLVCQNAHREIVEELVEEAVLMPIGEASTMPGTSG